MKKILLILTILFNECDNKSNQDFVLNETEMLKAMKKAELLNFNPTTCVN